MKDSGFSFKRFIPLLIIAVGVPLVVGAIILMTAG